MDDDVHMESNALKILQSIIDKTEDKNLQRFPIMIGDELKNSKDIRPEDVILLRFIGYAASMKLVPENNDEPFQVSTILLDGTPLNVFNLEPINCSGLLEISRIAEKIDYSPLKARIFDLLWVLESSLREKYIYAEKAISCYISGDINNKVWSDSGIKEFERAYRLSKKLSKDGLITMVEKRLYDIFNSGTDDIVCWVADLIKRIEPNFRKRTDVLKNKGVDIASKLEGLGGKFEKAGDFHKAAIYFELSSKYYEENSEDKHIAPLVQAADCYIQEADKHFDSDQALDLRSSGFFQDAIDLYSKVPKKSQDEYLINTKIAAAYCKLRTSNKRLLKHMDPLCIRSENLGDIKIEAKRFVSHKKTIWESLLYFSKILAIPSCKSLKESKSAKIDQPSIDHLYSKFDLEQNGKTIAKTHAVEFAEGQASIDKIVETHLIRDFNDEIKLRVDSYILPALEQILSEYAISKDYVFDICNLSPIVPISNIQLISHAIWLGFERDFSTAIHLVAPQMELIVRTQLNNNDVDNTLKGKNEEKNIEKEKGLSSLLEIKGINEVFNGDEIFELTAVFANPSGPNLRNKVAHGLMNDSSASSSAPIYAWWVLFRMVMHSIEMPTQKLDYE